MKAMVIKAFGDVDQLEVQELVMPIPKSDEVLIKVKAFGINRSETYMRKGIWGEVAKVTGIECVGTVVNDPSGQLKVGQTVAAIMGGMGKARNGSYAEYTCAPASNIFILDTDMDWVNLAAVPESYATAWGCLHQNMHIQPGDTVFIRGGTSALALAAINIASNIERVTVYGSTRFKEKKSILENAGCSQVFVEGENVSQALRQVEKSGVSSVLDLIGNTTLLDSLKMAKKGGYVCHAGFLGGGEAIPFNSPICLPPFVNLNFFGSFMFGSDSYPLSDIPMQEIVENVSKDIYKAKPENIFAFEEIPQAHQMRENNEASGKIVVEV